MALVVVGLLAGVVTAVGAWYGTPERVTGMWSGAVVGRDGIAHVREVIDYDFGSHRRHGIFRDVPDLWLQDPVRARSVTAPDDLSVSTAGRIRIGDPARTVSGRHQYTVEYGLDRVVSDGRLGWDAVGTGWPVGISNIEIHVVAAFELRDASCVHGPAGSRQACALTQPEAGHLVAEIAKLDAGEGVTVHASAGPSIGAAPPLPAQAAGKADPGIGVIVPGLLAGAVAVAAALLAARLIRRAGRERVAAGDGGEVRIDSADLASLAAVEPAPPPGLTAAQGGVLLAEAVRDEHKVAWLISAAIAGHILLETSGGTITLVRLRRAGGTAEQLLETAFAGRARLPLDTYDPHFARAWALIGDELETWQRECGLWDRAGDTRRARALVLGCAAGLGGLVLAALGGAATSRWGPLGLAAVVMGALLAGGGLAALARGRELRVRTPQGTGMWLRVESFRRFVTGAHAYPTGHPAERELSPDYTDWAISLGESDQWSQIPTASDSVPVDIRAHRSAVLRRTLRRGIAVASTEPSSSGGSDGGGVLHVGGGGGGGRSVGGGSGGGGGGSW